LLPHRLGGLCTLHAHHRLNRHLHRGRYLLKALLYHRWFADLLVHRKNKAWVFC
jgi:hypothetical protein